MEEVGTVQEDQCQTQRRRVEQLKTIQAEALDLFTRKNADYGDAFAKYGVILGIEGV